MNAVLADRLPRWTMRLAAWPWVLFVVETLVLFAALAAPFFLFEIGWTLLVVVSGVAVGHIILGVSLAGRQNRGEFEKPPFRFGLLVFAFRISFMFVAFGMFIVVPHGWEFWAYTTNPSTERAYETIWEVLGILVAPPVLFLALVRPWGKTTPTAEILRAVRSKGFAYIRSDWIGGAAIVIALLCSMSISGRIFELHPLLTQMRIGEEPSVLEMAGAFPFLPLGLLVVAAMLAVHRMTASGCMSSGAIVNAYTGVGGETPIPATGRAVVAVLCGWAVASYVVLAPVHLERINERSSTVGMAATLGAQKAIEEWAEARRADGLTGAELAAILNERGSWSPDSPEAGIPDLFPQLRDRMPVGNDTGEAACNITIAAAATDPAAVRDIDWLTPDQSDLKYCIRTACPSPVAWDAPDTVMLASSHSSRNEQWMNFIFIDIFAEGRVPAPGGYCTADGGLADEFQG